MFFFAINWWSFHDFYVESLSFIVCSTLSMLRLQCNQLSKLIILAERQKKNTTFHFRALLILTRNRYSLRWKEGTRDTQNHFLDGKFKKRDYSHFCRITNNLSPIRCTKHLSHEISTQVGSRKWMTFYYASSWIPSIPMQ